MPRRRRPFVAWPRHPLTGRQFRISAPTSAQLAKRLGYVQTLRDELRLGVKSVDEIDRQLRRLTHGEVTLERAARSYMESGIAPNTRRAVAAFLAGAGASLGPEVIDALDGPRLERWTKSAPLRRLAPSSVRSYWWYLRAIVRHAATRGWIARVPWGGWRPRLSPSGYAPPRAMREAARSAEELAALLDAAAAIDAERERARDLLPDVEAKVACAAYAGLRQGELAGLRWSDIDESRCVLSVARQRGRDRTKQGGAPRELAVAPELMELLARHRARLLAANLYGPKGPVFPSWISRPGRVRPYEARTDCLRPELVRQCAERARLPHPERWTAHSLRDTFATLEALAHAGDLEAVRDRTRHASTASLLRYLRSRSREPAPPGFSLPDRSSHPKLDAPARKP
jgi:integrase